LNFEPNRGQTDARVQYLAHAPGYTVFLSPSEAVFALSGAAAGTAPSGAAAGALPQALMLHGTGLDGSARASLATREVGWEEAVVRMQLLDSNPLAQASGADRLPGMVNYFLGNNPSRWRTRIPTYAQVHYQDVYPGIGLIYHGNQEQLEYDFQVAPWADPGQIQLRFAGAQSWSVDAAGSLVVRAGGQVLRQHKPFAYQEVAGARREVAVAFAVQGSAVRVLTPQEKPPTTPSQRCPVRH
jgi:hypothetical protein